MISKEDTGDQQIILGTLPLKAEFYTSKRMKMLEVNYCLNSLVNEEVYYINNFKGMFSLSVPCIH